MTIKQIYLILKLTFRWLVSNFFRSHCIENPNGKYYKEVMFVNLYVGGNLGNYSSDFIYLFVHIVKQKLSRPKILNSFTNTMLHYHIFDFKKQFVI